MLGVIINQVRFRAFSQHKGKRKQCKKPSQNVFDESETKVKISITLQIYPLP